jgi:putative multiple sugar transport system substrate-binding protein
MKKTLKLLATLLATAAITICFASCANDSTSNPTAGTATAASTTTTDSTTTTPNTDNTNTTPRVSVKIGISMPTDDSGIWKNDGNNLKSKLEALGHTVSLQFAENNANTQGSQLTAMISDGCKVLIISTVDSSALTDVLNTAKGKSIPVICYDRLAINTKAVSYFVTFNNRKVGTLQGNYLVNQFSLKTRTDADPVYMEFFAGAPTDNNSKVFFDGAMEILQQYITSGVIVCRSGETELANCATIAWSTDNAKTRMTTILNNNYNTKKLDAVYCSSDCLSQGVWQAIDEKGGYVVGTNYPVITGQDCDTYAVKAIKDGKLAMSVFKDRRDLATKTCEVVDAICQKKTVPTKDTDTNNSKIDVPTYLCDPVTVDKTNYKKVLIDSGYYKESDIQ